MGSAERNVRENRKIERRYLWGISFRLKTPLCISGGEREETDYDVIRNFDGVPLIPGSSLAGAMRDYLTLSVNEASMMGYKPPRDRENEDAGRMSSLFVSDTLLKGARVYYRDGISLENKANVINKFDWEIIDVGAAGTFYLELVIRQGDNEEACVNRIKAAVYGMQRGLLRLGHKKSRGFGVLQIERIYQWTFDSKRLLLWLDFEKPDPWVMRAEGWEIKTPVGAEDLTAQWIGPNVQEQKRLGEKTGEEKQFAVLSVPLRLRGGISIRQYSAESGEADYEHIRSNHNKVPVVPGTSWNGAIRSRAVELLQELGIREKSVKAAIEGWFGSKDTGRSLITIGESTLDGNAHMLQISRNKINRFDASTVQGALYTERACFEGNTRLELLIEKREDAEWKAAIGLLLLIIQDIRTGFLPIGGLTAIGRGIFEGAGEMISEGYTVTECEDALARWVREAKRCGGGK